MFCKNCGKEISNDAVICPECGVAIENQTKSEDTIFCSNCGQKINKKALICPHCGVGTENYRADQNKAVSQPQINVINNNTNTNANINAGMGYIHKKKWVAFFLCLFLGGLGAHRFYVGKAGTGIIYLFSGALFGIGWLIDLILILVGGFHDRAGQPLI